MIPKRYIQFGRAHKGIFIIGLIAGMITGLSSGFGVPFFVEKVFRRIFEDTETQYGLSYLIFIASLLPSIFLVRGIASYINQYFLHWVSLEIIKKLRNNLFSKIQSLSLSYFSKRQTGDLMAKLVGDTLQIQETILLIARHAFLQPFTFLAGLGYLIFLSIQQEESVFIFLILAIAPLIVFPVIYIGIKLKKRSRELQKSLGFLANIIAENLRGIVEIRSFNLQNREIERFESELSSYNRFSLKIAKYFHLTQPSIELIAVIALSISFVYSYQNDIGFSLFASMGAALFFTIDSLKRFIRMVTTIQKSAGSFERIEEVFKEEDGIKNPDNPVHFPKENGSIRFKEVDFAYDEEITLSVSDLIIPQGSVCALVGASGTGKSTLAKLIPRFYDPTKGKITINGVDIKSCLKEDLRACISYVAQDPVLFNGTVMDNLLLARPEATKEEIYAAAHNAYADEFIDLLPNKYETLVGENALRLSGGQRQRLALARAYLKDAPILILDEVTSALDSDSESKIEKSLRAYASGRTVIIIAHKLATIKHATLFVYFKKGKIHKSGSLEELLADESFRDLWNIQNS